MGDDGDRCSLVERLPDGRRRRDDPAVVGDLAPVERHVQVGPEEQSPTVKVEIGEPPFPKARGGARAHGYRSFRAAEVRRAP